jgi:hypothetical protein
VWLASYCMLHGKTTGGEARVGNEAGCKRPVRTINYPTNIFPGKIVRCFNLLRSAIGYGITGRRSDNVHGRTCSSVRHYPFGRKQKCLPAISYHFLDFKWLTASVAVFCRPSQVFPHPLTN